MTEFKEICESDIIIENGHGCCVIVENKNGCFLMGTRSKENVDGFGTWGFPGGSIEIGETPEQAIIRELKEETNLSISDTNPVEFIGTHENSRGKLDFVFYTNVYNGELSPQEGEVGYLGWFLTDMFDISEHYDSFDIFEASIDSFDLFKMYMSNLSDIDTDTKSLEQELLDVKEEVNLEKRMYFLVPYNISPIQQGIQAGHAVVEYGLEFGDTSEYLDWAENWKTFIILNGGTSNNASESYYGVDQHLGSMENHITSLLENGIDCSMFKEPDLNYCLTGISFIVDERVFNRKDYPDFEDWYEKTIEPITNPLHALTYKEPLYSDWLELIGGEKNVFLREFLRNFRLA